MSDKDPIRLQLVIPFHQPLTKTDADMAEACKNYYIPLLDALERAANVRVALHFTGHLLDYLARKQEDQLLRLKNFTKRGQVEILGGLFYGGIPALLPEMDVRGQIEMSGEFWDSFLGVTPRGFWLSELAWTPEMPRLLEETGLEYGFISASQLHMEPSQQRALGCIERGGQRIAAYVLDPLLSGHLPLRPPQEWLQGAIDRGSQSDHRLVNVWVRAESLGLEPGTKAWCLGQDGWLDRWFSAISAATQIEPVLPAETFPGVHPVEILRLRHACAPELQALGQHDAAVDWADFPFEFGELDTLYRRMLRASDKLREAIGVMEDEELEETWSDTLATAQRLVFGAQASDVYWRGPSAGFGDPAERDAVMGRILRAESMIDALVQGDEDWLSTEEEDLDGDLSEEVFVATRHLLAWLVPAQGGNIRSLDDRGGERNVFDVGARRKEPFFAALTQAPQAPTQAKNSGAPSRRGENLPRPSGALPMEAEVVSRRGLRQWIVEAATEPAAFFAGQAADLATHKTAWEVENSGIDEDGDCSYTLNLSRQQKLTGAKPRILHTHRTINVPIDTPHIHLDANLRLEGAPAVLWALEIPVRLGLGPARLWADGKEVTPPRPVLSQVLKIRLQSGDNAAFEVEFAKPCDVWWLQVRTTLRDLEGYRAVDQGTVLVATVRVESEADVRLSLHVVPRAD